MMYLDLDELEEVLAMSPLWSSKAWRPARFARSDFLGDPQVSLKQAVIADIHHTTGHRHDGSVRLLANLRYFGFNINPISCYYCFDCSEVLRYIVVEVTNTPWGERQRYVLCCDAAARFQRIDFQKRMHVSPFNSMNLQYRWCSNLPAKILSLDLKAEQDHQIQMDATMALQRHEINGASLNRILLQHPWMSAKVAAAIYWQALILWLKGNRFYGYPGSSKQPCTLAPPPNTTTNTPTRLKTKT